VIQSMKQYDISQVPVLNPDGTLAGLVNEVTVLQHMLELEHTHSVEETLERMIRPAKSVYPGYTLLEEILPAVTEGNVIIVTDDGKPTGILTKIDLLDYIAQSL
jgi:cystathionine beta-synthase